MTKITYAYIETTNVCNLACSFCNRDEVIGKLQFTTINEFKNALEKIKDQPLKETKLMGMGEPFMHPKYHEICKVFKDYFPNTILISATNCQYKINRNFTESLKYIDILYLSIDGYKENYEKYRKNSEWNKLITFLEDLNNVDRYNCKIVVNYVVNPNNILDIEKVNNEIVIPYNIEEIRLNIAQNWSENEHIVIDYTEEDIKYLKDNWSNNIKGKSDWDYKDCFWVQNGLYVTVDGDVKVCCINTSAKSLGNIYTSTIDAILGSEEYQKIKTGCELNNPTNHCKNCSYKELVPILKKLKND